MKRHADMRMCVDITQPQYGFAIKTCGSGRRKQFQEHSTRCYISYTFGTYASFFVLSDKHVTEFAPLQTATSVALKKRHQLLRQPLQFICALVYMSVLILYCSMQCLLICVLSDRISRFIFEKQMLLRPFSSNSIIRRDLQKLPTVIG